MLNMERMVGTITPKNVFSLRGFWVGSPGLGSWVESEAAPHDVRVRPHTPEVIRGVRSFDMAEARGAPGYPVKKKAFKDNDMSIRSVSLGTCP